MSLNIPSAEQWISQEHAPTQELSLSLMKLEFALLYIYLMKTAASRYHKIVIIRK